MPQFVAFLRGVNVGKGNRVPMAAFRTMLEAQGYSGVRTVLNSGNAIFSAAAGSSAAHAQEIHSALHETLGLDVRVVVMSAGEFSAAVAQNPLVPLPEQHSLLLVAFAQEPAAVRGLAVLEPMVQPPERFIIGSHAAYLLCAGGILKSKAGSALLGKTGESVTTRNWATVLKLKELLVENAA